VTGRVVGLAGDPESFSRTTRRDPGRRYVPGMPQDRVAPRRSRRVNWALVDRLTGLVIFLAIELQLEFGPGRHWRALPAFGGLVLALAVAFRRRWPLVGPLVFVAGWTVQTFLSKGGGLHGSAAAGPGLLLLFYGMGAFASGARAYWAFGAVVALASVNTLHRGGTSAAAVPLVIVFTTVLPWGLGRMMRALTLRAQTDREAAERLESTRDVAARTASHDERARIARELHDVITHSVSVMVIQAGAARMVMETQPERAEASLRSVERAGRDALAEMRRLLGVFDSDDGPAALSPQPGLVDIDRLIVDAQESGLTVSVRVDGSPVALPPALELCVYRVVQEALTNIIKHAGAAHAEVHMSWESAARVGRPRRRTRPECRRWHTRPRAGGDARTRGDVRRTPQRR
jgi:signal transduction histidine kinase